MTTCNILSCWMPSLKNEFSHSLCHTFIWYICTKKLYWSSVRFCCYLFCIMIHLVTVWLGNFSKIFLACFFLLFPIMYDLMTALIKIRIFFFFCSHSNLIYYLSQLPEGNSSHFAIKSEDESVCSDNIFLLTWVAYILYCMSYFFVLLIARKRFRNVDFLYVLCSSSYANNFAAWK